MTDSKETNLHVYQAISQVTAAVAKVGIAKGRQNTQQKYAFRGIDDIYNVLAPLLAEAGLCVLPNVVHREVVERKSSSGGALFYVVVKTEFCFVSSKDGSKHTVVTYGEAMDSGDKATNKAMSAAQKYAFLQTFTIPTEGDNDADQTTPPPIAPQSITLDEAKGIQAKILALTSSPENAEALTTKICTQFKIGNIEELQPSQLGAVKAILDRRQAKIEEAKKASETKTDGENK